MSELQIDDPDPLPKHFTYPVNMVTDLAYEGYDLSADLAEQERIGFQLQAERERIRLDRESVERLSNHAREVLESNYATGDVTERRAVSGKTKLYRKIVDGGWIFSIVDDVDSRQRCRVWTVGADSLSWCEDEERYESADEVLSRLAEAFPLPEQVQRAESVKAGTKRILALIGLRAH